jgi:hypothetical protein
VIITISEETIMPHSTFISLSSPHSSLSARASSLKPWQTQHSFLKPASEERRYDIAIQTLKSIPSLKQVNTQDNSTPLQMSFGKNSMALALATAYKELCTAAYIPFRGEALLLDQENHNNKIEDILNKGYLPALEKLLELHSDKNKYPIETGIKDDSQRELVISALTTLIDKKKGAALSQESILIRQEGPR